MKIRAISAISAVIVSLAAGASYGGERKEWTTSSPPGDGSLLSMRGRFLGDKLVRKSFSECRPHRDIKGLLYCEDKFTRGEPLASIVVNIAIIYENEKMVGFFIRAPRSKSEDLLLLMTGKFGPPSSSIGADKFWDTPWGPMMIQEHCNSGLSCAFFQESESIDRTNKAAIEAKKAVGKAGL